MKEAMLDEKLSEGKVKCNLCNHRCTIKDGNYGICEECEEEISEGRLRARPVTTLCIECKREQEIAEKAK